MPDPRAENNLWLHAPRPGIILQRGRARAYPTFAQDDYHFGLVTDGGLLTRRRAGEDLARPGELTALHPAEAHSGHSFTDAGWSYRLIVVDQRIVRAALAGQGVSRDLYFPRLVIADDLLARGFGRAFMTLADPTSDLEFDEVLTNVINAFVKWSDARNLPQDNGDDRTARRVLEVLQARYTENLSLDLLAQAVGANKYQLAKGFKRLTGLPPHAFQTQLRVSAARRLLASEMSLVEIALECGFYSQAHLNRHFSRLLGIAPGLFRRILREGGRS